MVSSCRQTQGGHVLEFRLLLDIVLCQTYGGTGDDIGSLLSRKLALGIGTRVRYVDSISPHVSQRDMSNT